MARAYTSSKSGITTSYIRRYITRLSEDRLFTTRELLPYGSRCAVDKVLSRMVEEGRIRRWARGVFARAAKPTIEDIARVKAESFGRKIISYGGQVAKALGLVIDTGRAGAGRAGAGRAGAGRAGAGRVEAGRVEADRNGCEAKHIYCINGRTSSFMVGGERIYLKQTGPRKMALVEDRIEIRTNTRAVARTVDRAEDRASDRVPDRALDKARKDQVGEFIRGLWHLGKEGCDEFAIEIASQTLRNRFERTEVRQLANIMPSWLADKLSRWRFSPAVP